MNWQHYMLIGVCLKNVSSPEGRTSRRSSCNSRPPLWSGCCVGRWTLHSTTSCQSPACIYVWIMIHEIELSLYIYVWKSKLTWQYFTFDAAWALRPSIQLYPTPSLNCSFCLYRICCNKASACMTHKIQMSEYPNIYDGKFSLKFWTQVNYHLGQEWLLLIVECLPQHPLLNPSKIRPDLQPS